MLTKKKKIMWQCLINLPWHEILMKGVITSLIASGIFLLLLYLLRPRIKISPQIAKKGDQYLIKTINRSFFRLYDIQFQLTLKHYYGGPGGRNVKYKRINLKHNFKLTYPKRPFFEKYSEFFEHAVLLTIEDNLHAEWDNESDVLEFVIIAKHGLSSFAKIKKITYTHIGTDIANGSFKHGNCFEIVNS